MEIRLNIINKEQALPSAGIVLGAAAGERRGMWGGCEPSVGADAGVGEEDKTGRRRGMLHVLYAVMCCYSDFHPSAS